MKLMIGLWLFNKVLNKMILILDNGWGGDFILLYLRLLVMNLRLILMIALVSI